MSQKGIAAGLLFLLLLTGCARGSGSESSGVGSEVDGLSLQLSPASGPPGSEVRVTLRVPEPGFQYIGFDPFICWGSCGSGGMSRRLRLESSPDDPRLLSGSVTLPMALRVEGKEGLATPLAAGDLEVHVACVSRSFGCASRSDVSATFRVERSTPRFAWERLPAGAAIPVPRLGIMADQVRSSAAGSLRSAVCTKGNFDPRYGNPPPQILLTDEQGRSEEPITFTQGNPLNGRHGWATCGAMALDPQYPDTLYVMEGRHAGGAGKGGAYQVPHFTRDRGQSWSPVEAPEGFDPGRSFVGFEMIPDGVIAWFSTIPLEGGTHPVEGIRGRLTQDGGQRWRTVDPRSASASAPSLLQVYEAPPSMRSGLLHFGEDGESVRWSAYGGTPFTAAGVYALASPDRQVLEALGVGPATDWAWIPMLRSEDGGKSWTWVDLPAPPGGWVAEGSGQPLLEMEASGAVLLKQKEGEDPARWYRLDRGSLTWRER